MPKIADVYLDVNDFEIIENGFHPAHALVSESIFSLANEYMGVRGYIDEGLGDKSLRGTYLNGVYELNGDQTPGGYKGIVKQTHYMVTCADMFYTKLSLRSMRLKDFSRILDMRSGLLTRKAVYETEAGTLELKAQRLVSMTHKELAAQLLTLTSDQSMSLSVTLGIDGTVRHQTTGQNHFIVTEQTDAAMTLETQTSMQRLSYAYRLNRRGGFVKNDEKRLSITLNVNLEANVPFTIEKINAVLREADAAAAEQYVRDAPCFLALLDENKAHYDAFWDTSDVKILGDALNQQGIRFCLFQLHQTYRGAVAGSNIGAKGLTGEAYNGHAFWDTETYCVAPYLLTEPEAAKNLLLYRYQTLAAAKKRAVELDLKGACYPIATLNGNEACTLWQHASLQMQPSTAVAYAIMYYYHMTGDEAFLLNEGAEMLVEIARYCVSRGDWNQDGTGFGYYGVMGPDEFHLMVNNNFYTNFMGKKALEAALLVLEKDVVRSRLQVTDGEIANFKRCAAGMILEKRADDVYPQHEGYFSLPHLDIHAIPQVDFPLYHHWSYDRIYRTDMIKQPDVLMAMFLYPSDFTLAEIKANYDYYEQRCIHESSLSPSVHSVIAAWLGLNDDAYRFFGFATRLDLDNYNNNTGEGLHTTSLAAAWVTIVYGFLGLKTDGISISLAPQLPKWWQGLTLKLMLFGRRIQIAVTQTGTKLTLLSGAAITVTLYGEKVEVCDQ